MGIYSDGLIYGVSLRRDDVKLFEKIYKEKMTASQIHEVEVFYEALTDKQIDISFYTSCSSTYMSEPNRFMTWVPGNKNLLIALFATSR
jgi:hypothetical protein